VAHSGRLNACVLTWRAGCDQSDIQDPSSYHLYRFSHCQCNIHGFILSRTSANILVIATNSQCSKLFFPALPSGSADSSLFLASLYVHNSGDLNVANSTLQPLYNYIQNEKDAGRPIQVSIQSAVHTDYFQLYSTPLDQVYEGAGVNLAVGGRLLPASLFEEGKVDSLVNLVLQTQFLPVFALGEFI
jgi:hypothetical protein